MPRPSRNSWLLRRAESALRSGFERAYETVRVDPQHYLFHLRAAHGLPISSFQGVYSLPLEQLDALAAGTIRAGMKIAVADAATRSAWDAAAQQVWKALVGKVYTQAQLDEVLKYRAAYRVKHPPTTAGAAVTAPATAR